MFQLQLLVVALSRHKFVTGATLLQLVCVLCRGCDLNEINMAM